MPVTVRPVTHPPRPWSQGVAVASTEKLLNASCPKEYKRCKEVIQSSFNDFPENTIYPSSNGFVRAAYAAYSDHHHLTLRPEDIWFAILTQLSFHINAHAEELRSFFVSHKGQKDLKVVDSGTISLADFGKMAIWMTREIEKNVNDPDLRTWIMPDFSTTTHTDMVTAAVLMMGSMQKYFTYTMSLDCGMPSVTLLGEKEDWIKIRRRLDMLPRLGKEPEQFASLLVPVLDYFVRSFDEPESRDVISFWSRIAHQSGGSGPNYLSGWITAFCFWSAEGECLYRPPKGPIETDSFGARNPGCDLDGTLFHRVDTEDIPDAFVSVPVTVDDNGTIYHTRMVAGSVGIEVSSSGETLEEMPPRKRQRLLSHQPLTTSAAQELSRTTGPDSLKPVSGWWMYELIEAGDDKTNKKRAVQEGQRLPQIVDELGQGIESTTKKQHQEVNSNVKKLHPLLRPRNEIVAGA
ncbi:hypothetical protein F4677DRAFT_414398 [Hypoxylon crocopeplum]|nr:hypothetical protein F4677DRAFT_414398 [Hypoxylon crocopeplum]